MKGVRLVLAGILTLALSVATAAATHERTLPQRLVAVSQNGSTVTLHFENGNTVDVPAASVKIREASHPSHQRAVVSVAQLGGMSAAGPLPAVAFVQNGAQGSVTHVRVRVFESDAETRAFLQRSADRRAARNAKTSNQ